jgi:hypothetical protein
MLDEKAYNQQKLKLPYFIGARFNDNIRNLKNFIEINWMIIDIDKCFNTIEQEIELKERLKNDSRIHLMFTSPGNQGLKLLYKLETPVTDSVLFSNMYKAFTAELARNYKLADCIDFKTFDVTRVSFLSVDPDVYINNNAVPVTPGDYISKYDLFNKSGSNNSKTDKNNRDKQHIDNSVYAEILTKLNPKTPRRKKIIFVPEVLNSVISPIKNFTQKTGLEITEIRDIHYGKKLTFKRGNDFAEINLFYGKNGFTTVISLKRGHHPELAKVAKAIIEKVIYDDPVRTTKTELDSNIIANSIKNLSLN